MGPLAKLVKTADTTSAANLSPDSFLQIPMVKGQVDHAAEAHKEKKEEEREEERRNKLGEGHHSRRSGDHDHHSRRKSRHDEDDHHMQYEIEALALLDVHLDL